MTSWTCPFCMRGRPEVNTSREHTVPRWISRIPSVKALITLEKNATYRQVPITKFDHASQVIATQFVRVRSKALHVTQKTQTVCQACNNGWMATLEERSKEILTPAIEGVNIRFSPSEAETVARWALKTSVVAELDLPEMSVIDVDQRTSLLGDCMPVGFAVYTARSAIPGNFAWTVRAGIRHSKVDGKRGPQSGTHVGVLMSPGHLALLVRVVQPSSATHAIRAAFPPLGEAWTQAWPLAPGQEPQVFKEGISVNPKEALLATGVPDLPVL